MSTRPIIEWRTDRPPPAKKVIYLSCWGVLVVGQVTTHEWDAGYCVCWQQCPKKPSDWDAMLDAAEQRKGRP